MKIKGFSATVRCPVSWETGRYSAFAGASDLFINEQIVPNGSFVLKDGDAVTVLTPCNKVSGTAKDVVREGEYYVFSLTNASYSGAFHGVGGDYDGFRWEPVINAKTPIETTLPGLKTWGGYCRFREELAEAASKFTGHYGDPQNIGGWGSVSRQAAERAALNFRANRPMSLSLDDIVKQ